LVDKVKSHPRVFFGWWTTLVTGIITGLGFGFFFYGISVFFKDLAAELAVNRAVTATAASIGRLEGGIMYAVSGWLADRLGPKWVIVIGIAIMVAGLIMMSFISSVGGYLIAWGVLTGIGFYVGLTVANDQALTNWFIRKRGLAQGIKHGLIGMCGVVILPVVNWLVTTYEWRTTCLIWSIVMLTGIPLTIIFVRQKRPEYYGLFPDGVRLEPGAEKDTRALIERGVEYASSFQETEFSFRQAVRTPTYWMIASAFGLHTIVIGGFVIHTIPFLTDIGFEQTVASGMMGLMIFFTIPARFLGGFLVDHVQKKHLQYLVAGTFLLQAASIGIFLLSRNTASVYALLVLYGFSSGASIPLLIVIIGRYFGRKDYGSIIGCCMMFQAVSTVGPIFSGWIYDTYGDYTIAFATLTAIALCSTLIMCLVRAPRLPAADSDIPGIKR
jgi:MFS family permease